MPFKGSRKIDVFSKLLNCEWNVNSGEFFSLFGESKTDLDQERSDPI